MTQTSHFGNYSLRLWTLTSIKSWTRNSATTLSFSIQITAKIIPITEKRLYLVGAYKIEENQIQEFTPQFIQGHLKEACDITVAIPKTFNYDTSNTPLNEIADIARNLSYTDHGIMFKTGQLRTKVLSDKYMFIRALKGNTNKHNLMERYLIVMKNKMIKQYLIHFPEVKEQFRNTLV